MRLQFSSDTAAVGLSGLCILHCLAVPLLLMLMPFAALQVLESEVVHQVMLVLVVPVSCYALIVGFKTHRSLKVLLFGLFGLVGLLVLMNASIVGHDWLGHEGETLLTLLGSLTLALAHWQNGRIRKQYL